MIHALYLTALWFLSLVVAYKMGGANEQIRVQRVLRGVLDEGEPRRLSDAGRSLPLRASRHAPDSEAPGARTPSPSSSVFDGESETALEPPGLSIVPEPPGLRVVKW